LDNEKQKTQYYAEQLRLAPDPEKIIFEIEEVLDERISKEDGKPQILVKYLYYPCKLLFNLIVCKLGLIKIINKESNCFVFLQRNLISGLQSQTLSSTTHNERSSSTQQSVKNSVD